MNTNGLYAVIIAFLIFPLTACTSYKSQEVPFRLPAAAANMQEVAGAQVAATGFADEGEAKKVFGFNIRDAGLLPVQVVVDNQGAHGLIVVPEQTFLIDDQGNLWNLLDRRTAYQRMEKSSEYANIAKGAGRGGMLGAAGGALVGAALGILTGENVGTAATAGAAVGGAGGAVIGGGQSAASPDAGREISRDLANKELENRTIDPGMIGRGFLFFPGEAPSAGAVRLQLKEEDTGRTHTINLSLQ